MKKEENFKLNIVQVAIIEYNSEVFGQLTINHYIKVRHSILHKPSFSGKTTNRDVPEKVISLVYEKSLQ